MTELGGLVSVVVTMLCPAKQLQMLQDGYAVFIQIFGILRKS
jgi:hypothetical protein